jgi:ferric-dicitrate binding protein FerR (iron transport regulator)
MVDVAFVTIHNEPPRERLTVRPALEDVVSRLSRGFLAFLVLVGLALPGTASAQSIAPDATLSIFTGSVLLNAGSGWVPAADGQLLSVGQRIRAGTGGAAMISHSDGTTTTLDGDTEILLERQSPTATGGSNVVLRLEAGRIWSRVVKLVDPSSSFEIRGSSGSARIRDGLIGARIGGLGELVCWTFEGDVQVASAGKTVTLKPN